MHCPARISLQFPSYAQYFQLNLPVVVCLFLLSFKSGSNSNISQKVFGLSYLHCPIYEHYHFANGIVPNKGQHCNVLVAYVIIHPIATGSSCVPSQFCRSIFVDGMPLPSALSYSSVVVDDVIREVSLIEKRGIQEDLLLKNEDQKRSPWPAKRLFLSCLNAYNQARFSYSYLNRVHTLVKIVSASIIFAVKSPVRIQCPTSPR